MNKERLTKAVIACKGGDLNAFNIVYSEAKDSLYIFAKSIANRKGLDASQADDIFQEAFMAIFKSIGNIKDPDAFITWSKVIMRNVANKKYAGVTTEFTVSTDEAYEMFEQIPDDEDFVNESISSELEKSFILQALDSIAAHYREVITCFYCDEMSIIDIASVLNIPEGTVKSRLHNARIAFRKEIEKLEVKQGVKVHALAPLMLMNMKNYTATIAGLSPQLDAKVLEVILKGISTAVKESIRVAEATTKVAEANANSANNVVNSAYESNHAVAVKESVNSVIKKGAAAKVAATAAHSLSTKVIAGVLAASLTIGGGYGIHKAVSKGIDYVVNKDVATIYEKVLAENSMENEYRGVDDYDDPYSLYAQYNSDGEEIWKQTALCDITGDNEPELFYGRHIYTIDGGQAVDLVGNEYDSDYQNMIGCEGLCAVSDSRIGTIGAIVYESKAHNALYRISYDALDIDYITITKLEVIDGSIYVTNQIDVEYYGDDEKEFYAYRVGEISQEEFNKEYKALSSDFGRVINYSISSLEDISFSQYLEPIAEMGFGIEFSELKETETLAMSYEEMLDYLRSISGTETSVSDENKELISSIDGWWGIPNSGVESFTITPDGAVVFHGSIENPSEAYASWEITGANEITITFNDNEAKPFTLKWNKSSDTLYTSEYDITYSRLEGSYDPTGGRYD